MEMRCCIVANHLTNILLQLNIFISIMEDKHGKQPILTEVKESTFFIINNINEVFKAKNFDECARMSDKIIKKIMELYYKLEKIAPRDEIIGELKQQPIFNINIQNQNLVKDSGVSKVNIDEKIDININVEIDLPALQSGFHKFKQEVEELDADLKEELEDLENDLLEISPRSDQSMINKSMNKLSTFMQELNDENSKFNKIVKGTKRGMELAQELGKNYNKFAKFLLLPQVPDLFLEKH